MTIKHLTQHEVAERWRISHRTLERWRWTGEGPRFMKAGGRVVYRIEDVRAFEAEQVRKRTGERPKRIFIPQSAGDTAATAPLGGAS